MAKKEKYCNEGITVSKKIKLPLEYSLKEFLNQIEIDDILKTRRFCLFENCNGNNVIISKNLKGIGFILINSNGNSYYTKKLHSDYKFIKEIEYEVFFK